MASRRFFASVFLVNPEEEPEGTGVQRITNIDSPGLDGEVDRLKQLLKEGRITAFYVGEATVKLEEADD